MHERYGSGSHKPRRCLQWSGHRAPEDDGEEEEAEEEEEEPEDVRQLSFALAKCMKLTATYGSIFTG